MVAIILEILRTLLTGVLFLYLFRLGRQHGLATVSGWRFILGGLACLTFASLVDITDNFPSLGWLVVVGNTQFQALENVIGYMLGILLLAAGFWRWVPVMVRYREDLQGYERHFSSLGQSASDELDKLEGIITICSHCKQIRDSDGNWGMLEKFFSERSDVIFSHGVCHDCAEKHYGISISKPSNND